MSFLINVHSLHYYPFYSGNFLDEIHFFLCNRTPENSIPLLGSQKSDCILMTEILNLSDFLRIPFLSSMFYKSGIICTNYIRWNINTGPGLWISEHQLNRKYSTWHKGRLLTSWNGGCLSVCLYLHPLLYKGHACTGTPGRRLAAFFQRLQWNFSLSAGHVVAAMCCPLHFHLCVQKLSFLWSSHSELENCENMRDQGGPLNAYFELRQMLRLMMDGLG